MEILELGSVIVLGMTAMWLAWRLRLPSILLLLTFGFLAGPVLNLIHPDDLLGDLLFPIVSISVGLIMFEGALGLKFSQLREAGTAIRNMISVGVVISWTLTALFAHFILNLSWQMAILLGAILVVTGPTVIGPLLRFVRPNERVANVLRWEGILIDPIGATLALLVFEYILTSSPVEARTGAVVGFVATLAVGLVVGLLAAGLLYVLMRRYWVPDHLQNPMTLMVVVGAFAVSDMLIHESGLLTVTVMGIALTNQRRVTVQHIVEFKENLGVLLIGSLFILLSARLDLESLRLLGLETILFIALLLLIVRPASVLVATLGSRLNVRERLFLAWMAPRGIVAAAVASIFSLDLVEAGYPEAERLVPIVFSVIVATVAIYGLTALPVARWLGVSPRTQPQGVLMVGAHSWAIAIAQALRDQNYRVLLVDTNYGHVFDARRAGLDAYHGTILSEETEEALSLDGIGRLIALTSNDEVNSLSALQYADEFERAELYQLPPQRRDPASTNNVPGHLRGRFLFQQHADFKRMSDLFEAGAVIETTELTREFDYAAFRSLYGERALPLFLIDPVTRQLALFTTDRPLTPLPGQKLISLIAPLEALPLTAGASAGVGAVAAQTG